MLRYRKISKIAHVFELWKKLEKVIDDFSNTVVKKKINPSKRKLSNENNNNVGICKESLKIFILAKPSRKLRKINDNKIELMKRKMIFVIKKFLSVLEGRLII